MSFVRSMAIKSYQPLSTGQLLQRTIVVQEFFDQVDMGQHHTPATVPFQLELVECVTKAQQRHGKHQAAAVADKNSPFAHVLSQQLKIGTPLVPNDFPARETTYGYNLDRTNRR